MRCYYISKMSKGQLSCTHLPIYIYSDYSIRFRKRHGLRRFHHPQSFCRPKGDNQAGAAVLKAEAQLNPASFVAPTPRSRLRLLPLRCLLRLRLLGGWKWTSISTRWQTRETTATASISSRGLVVWKIKDSSFTLRVFLKALRHEANGHFIISMFNFNWQSIFIGNLFWSVILSDQRSFLTGRRFWSVIVLDQ